jgi:hypothetical protein
MFRIFHRRFLLFVLAFLFFTGLAANPVMASNATSTDRSVANTAWCGRLSSYATWYYSNVERIWKPILYVWRGQGRGNPYAVSVYFNNQYVSNSGDGVQTWSGPQVDTGNGWVGYFIAKRFYMWPTNWQWDDDWRWGVRGCLP